MDPKVESCTNVPSGSDAEEPKKDEEKATVEIRNAVEAPKKMKSQESLDEGSAGEPSNDVSGNFASKNSAAMSFGESAAGSGVFDSAEVEKFLKRRATSTAFGIPPKFFQSRASIREWGEEKLTDPMVQPYDKDEQSPPEPFHVSLPGYSAHLCKYVLTKIDKPPRDPLLGPEISIYPPVWIPHWEPDPNFKPQAYNFNWEENSTFQMERLPYMNAVFDPADGSAHGMYKQAYPYTAYPYGVPRV